MERRDFLGFFYTLPMGERERRKALECGVRHIMVTYAHGLGDLPWLAEHGLRVTVRLNERDYTGGANRTAEVVRSLKALPDAQREAIELIVVGVEPEHGLDMTWESATGWGNRDEDRDFVTHRTPLEQHVVDFGTMRAALQRAGFVVCSPGWTCRDQDMRFGPPPNHGPQPGVLRWAMATLEEYGRADYNGEHLYLFDGSDFDIEQRAERLVNRAVSMRQREIVYDELNVGKADYTKEECMHYSLRIADMLRSSPRARRAFLFCLNGTPYDENGNVQWPPNQLMDTDLCYLQASLWLDGRCPDERGEEKEIQYR